MRWLLLVPMGLVFAWGIVQAQVAVSKPEVWMMPPAGPEGQCIRELFTRSVLDFCRRFVKAKR
jgi:hypothetical protein